MLASYESIDEKITKWMAHYGIRFLRYSIGFIFIWFGGLKFFPDVSPAQELATSTIDLLTFGLIPTQVSLFFLALLEVLIGILLISGLWIRLTLALLFFQMAGTLTPIVLFPDLVFTAVPYALTIEGQYIIKNVVILSAALVIGSTARDGKIVKHEDK
jgi:uncharacterized membrane protein YkgB